MAPRDTRQINWRATPPTADLLDLAILVRQSVDSDPTFTIKKAAEEATRTWALEQLRAYPDIATRSAVGLTIGAGPPPRDLDLHPVPPRQRTQWREHPPLRSVPA